jgi:2,4-dienoyl-CoA reductase-like NADH-dependent reductase (Old Yellow Enzyme family)
MAPMTRRASPGGIPGPDVAQYYARRARYGVGLIMTEGTWIDFPWSGGFENVPNFYGDEALLGWKAVAQAVHEAGGRIFPQLWNVGAMRADLRETGTEYPDVVSPSGINSKGERIGTPLSAEQVADLIDAYARGAETARALGFDGVEIHGAHGYLPDQFMSPETNRRTDIYGGDAGERGRFAGELVRECRRRVGPDFPISYRFSQWKLWNYDARLAQTPDELLAVLGPLVESGVDFIHCSTRRFWQPEFSGSALNLAGWVRKLTGVATITCGSVGLTEEFLAGLRPGGRAATQSSGVADLSLLLQMLERGEFDLVAVGRALLSDPEWASKVRDKRLLELRPYDPESLKALR